MWMLPQNGQVLQIRVLWGFICLLLCLLERWFCFVLFFLFPPPQRHMEFPGSGIESDLHWSCGNTGPLTHWARPGIKPASPERQAGSLTHCTTVGTSREVVFFFFLRFLFFLLQLIYIVLSISAVQSHIHSFSHIILHHVPPQVTRYSSPCYTAESHCLSTPKLSMKEWPQDFKNNNLKDSILMFSIPAFPSNLSS